MTAIPGRTTRQAGERAGLFFGVAAGVAVVFAGIAARPLLGGIARPPPPPSPCLIAAPEGLTALGRADSLENCAVQLEAVFLDRGQPVSGAYQGLRLFVDPEGIDAAQPHGPRKRLIGPGTRTRIDAQLHWLLRERDGGGTQLSVVRP